LDIGLSLVERDFKQSHITKREFGDIKKAIEDSKEPIRNNL